ncbi:hypothetical protein ABZ454_38945 [Streptomyces sp. NPDC005803]|uniref:hypothetical protein n=1 Tax=Streptomyces sp. NPDC005803 TaxID=3154297 RepID=UPI0033E6D03E
MTPAAARDVDISCRTKVGRYETHAEAKRAWKWLRKQPGRRHLQIYDCRHCPYFHIGNPPGHQTYMRSGHPYTTGRDTAA